MITLIAFSKNEIFTQRLITYEQGVFKFKLAGSTTFTDSLGAVWNWEGVETTQADILGIRYQGINLIKVDTLAECIAGDGSFFFDSGTSILYIQYLNSQGDWAVEAGQTTIQAIDMTFSDSYDPVSGNYYSGQFYEPILESVAGINLRADPLKLGLLGTNETSITINNSNGRFDQIDDKLSRGAVVIVTLMPEGHTDIADGTRIFTGYSAGLAISQKSMSIKAIEQRFFQDAIVCRNTLELADYASLADDFIGARKPVAFGDIRRGICIPLNSSGMDRADTGSITFLVSDPALGPVKAISKLYDNNGSELTSLTVNLTNCTVAWTKPANIDVDLKKFKWEGQGHELGFGVYNNGVDIMRFAFNEFAEVANVTSAFDDQAWLDAAINNPEPVGLSIWSDRGMTSEIIEPIATSLQVLLLTTGNGQLTVIERDITADPILIIDPRLHQVPISINYDTKYFVNQLKIEYSPDFTNKDLTKSIVNTDFEEQIITDYGNISTSEISTIKTVLTVEADAIALSDEIMATSKRPDKIIALEIAGFYDLKPFDIIDIFIGRDVNTEGGDERRLAEVLSYEPLPGKQNSKITCRIVGEYVYLTDEDGNYLITETGDYLIGEERIEA